MDSAHQDYDFTACRLFVAVVMGRAELVGNRASGAMFVPVPAPHPAAVCRCPSCGSRGIVERRVAETWRAGPVSVRRWLSCVSCNLSGPSGYGHPICAETRWNNMCEGYDGKTK